MLKASQSSSWNHSAEVWPPFGWYEIRWRPPSPLRRPVGHGADDRGVPLVLDRAVAAEDPDDRLVAIASAEELAVGRGVLGGEDLGALAPLLVPLVAPGRQHADDQPERVGAVDHGIHVPEIALDGPGGVVVVERQVAVGVRVGELVLGQDDGLDDRETLGGAVAQVGVRLLATRAGGRAPRRCRPGRRTASRAGRAGSGRSRSPSRDTRSPCRPDRPSRERRDHEGEQEGDDGEGSTCHESSSYPTMSWMSIRYSCRPWPPCGESMTTLRPSGLNRGCVSQRHSPVYSGGEWKWPSGCFVPRLGVVEVRVLLPLPVRVRVVEDHAPAGQVGAVAVLGHHVRGDDLDAVGAVLVEVELVAVRGVPGPGEDVARVAPDEVRGLAVRVEHVQVGPVRGGGDQAGREAAPLGPPRASGAGRRTASRRARRAGD